MKKTNYINKRYLKYTTIIVELIMFINIAIFIVSVGYNLYEIYKLNNELNSDLDNLKDTQNLVINKLK